MTNYEEPPEPTEEELDALMQSVAAQFGEQFEKNDSQESDEKIIDNLANEGWTFVNIVANSHALEAEAAPEKEIKIIGRGAKLLVFERAKNDIHGNYDYE